jgi:hypothetical protein
MHQEQTSKDLIEECELGAWSPVSVREVPAAVFLPAQYGYPPAGQEAAFDEPGRAGRRRALTLAVVQSSLVSIIVGALVITLVVLMTARKDRARVQVPGGNSTSAHHTPQPLSKKGRVGAEDAGRRNQDRRLRHPALKP